VDWVDVDVPLWVDEGVVVVAGCYDVCRNTYIVTYYGLMQALRLGEQIVHSKEW
jgi:hypothetical protein